MATLRQLLPASLVHELPVPIHALALGARLISHHPLSTGALHTWLEPFRIVFCSLMEFKRARQVEKNDTLPVLVFQREQHPKMRQLHLQRGPLILGWRNRPCSSPLSKSRLSHLSGQEANHHCPWLQQNLVGLDPLLKSVFHAIAGISQPTEQHLPGSGDD